MAKHSDRHRTAALHNTRSGRTKLLDKRNTGNVSNANYGMLTRGVPTQVSSDLPTYIEKQQQNRHPLSPARSTAKTKRSLSCSPKVYPVLLSFSLVPCCAAPSVETGGCGAGRGQGGVPSGCHAVKNALSAVSCRYFLTFLPAIFCSKRETQGTRNKEQTTMTDENE